MRRSDKSMERYQAFTAAGSINSMLPWTEADVAILRDPNLTILQKALILRRTYKGTAAACIGTESKSMADPV